MVEGCFCLLDRAPQSPGRSGSFLRIFLIPAPITLDRGLASTGVGLCCVGDPSPGRDQVLLLCCPGMGGHRF